MHQLTVLLEYINKVSIITIGAGQAHALPGPPLATPLWVVIEHYSSYRTDFFCQGDPFFIQ